MSSINSNPSTSGQTTNINPSPSTSGQTTNINPSPSTSGQTTNINSTPSTSGQTTNINPSPSTSGQTTNINPTPSTSGQTRNEMGHVDESMLSTHNQGLQTEWQNKTHPAQNSESIQHDNVQVSSNPIAYSRILLSKFVVKEYKPEDLEVSMANGFIVVNGSHREKTDEYSFVTSQFTIRVAIPRDILEEEIKVILTSNGILEITAMKSPKIRKIPIHQINYSNFELQRSEVEQQRMDAHIPSAGTDSDERRHIEEIEQQKSSVPIKKEEENIEDQGEN